MRVIVGVILSGLIFSGAARSETIAEADLLGHIEILASDAFEGRKPGTAGENKTVNYIATQWSRAGLRPAGNSASWYAPVALVERIPERFQIGFRSGTRSKPVRSQQNEIILRSRDPSFRQSDMAVVFAGYAQSGPGQSAVSVDGKLVILPRKAPGDDEDALDYRQRKLQLIEDGAVGIISVIADPDRWSRFRRFYQRGSTALAAPDNHALLEGLISSDQFRKLLRTTRLDAETLLAESANTSVVDLGVSADAMVETNVRPYLSHNVMGKIPGRNADSGAILFMGHWDHFGECRTKDPQEPGKDRICNGAVDNASGISLLIETAKRLSGEGHDRDIYFVATTAEEKGLLGARAFVQDPPIALEKFVAVFNADTIALSEDSKNIAVIGLDHSVLGKDIAIVAAQEGREIDRSGKSDPYLKRQDGYVFVERDIPAFMITSAFADEERLKAFLNGRYHDVTDEVNDNLVLAGAAADANFHVALGRYFASTARYPGKATSGGTDN
ncbi:M28 family peptidase [Parasphingorhabdus sp.]|uniref:M28 family peptidase n=1 Tax=Parasphingorhabdus sp. TaxID=2709688 RepID=UPI003A8F17C1